MILLIIDKFLLVKKSERIEDKKMILQKAI